MFLINGVLMRPDNVSESVDLLEDDFVKPIARHFPNIDTLPRDKMIATIAAIVSYIVYKSDIDYGSDSFRDGNKFEITCSLVGIELGKVFCEYIPLDVNVFTSLFKSMMWKNYGGLYDVKRNVLLYGLNDSCLAYGEYRKYIEDNRDIVISALHELR